MCKKNLKLLLTLFIVVAMMFSFSTCFAEVDGDITKSATSEIDEINEATTTSEDTADETEDTTEDPEIYNGDLYLYGTNVEMDKLVDGNVFIFGNNVNITGQVNGNLFVCANKVSFDNSYVRYSIFACAGSVYYNGACNDLYVATGNLEMTYDSYVVRDVKAMSSSTVLKAAIGRDVDLKTNTADFGSGEEVPIIYGNLRYSANEEKTFDEGIIQGEISYSNKISKVNVVEQIKNIVINILICIATVLVLYILIKLLVPNFMQKLSSKQLTVANIAKAFGIGLVTFVLVFVVAILLLVTQIGAKLALILGMLFAIICLISVPMLSVKIAKKMSSKDNLRFYLILVLVSIVLYAITLIPYAGFIFAIIIKLVAVGMLVDLVLPKKELSDEEKAAIEEAKKQAKADKEKRKQEKLEVKKNKKDNKNDDEDLS